ncbi:hypothetical protein OH77DRAFT_1418701 [Trametes cingulata]|nr:hypothetical protein OH77DRAFT_1418701 [Trametes cingulata]
MGVLPGSGSTSFTAAESNLVRILKSGSRRRKAPARPRARYSLPGLIDGPSASAPTSERAQDEASPSTLPASPHVSGETPIAVLRHSGSPVHPRDVIRHVSRIEPYAPKRTTSSSRAQHRFLQALDILEASRGRTRKQSQQENLSEDEKKLLNEAARLRTVTRLRAVIWDAYGHEYTPRPFGSTCYGAGNLESDVDVTIIDERRPHGIAPDDTEPLPKIYNVSHLGRQLMKNGYEYVRWIRAAVPIVKFTDPRTGLSCDVNINNRLGLYNTALIGQYCQRVPYLPLFLRIIKAWLKSVDLNNPSPTDPGKPKSFSSYAITLMTIAFLQNAGHAPNLQADTELLEDTYFWDNRFGLHRPVPIRFGRCRDWEPPLHDPPPTFDDWLWHWGHAFEYSVDAISMSDGGFIQRPEVPPQEWGHRSGGHNRDAGVIVVLDPLTSRNCTFAISGEVLERFKQACRDEWLKRRSWSSE